MKKKSSVLDRLIFRYNSNLIITSKNKKLLAEKNQIVLDVKNFVTKKDIKNYFSIFCALKIKRIRTLKYRKKKNFNKSKKIYINFI
jgi:ribosomal protein L23